MRSQPAPRHTEIGFPRESNISWQRQPVSGIAAPLAFAGQGKNVWQTAPSHGHPIKGQQPPNSSGHGQWQLQFPRHGRHDHFGGHGKFPDWFRWHRFFGPGYGFYGYGVGLFSYCPAWLGLDWEWQAEYSEECDNYANQQEELIAATGADQSGGGAQPDNRQFYGSDVYAAPSQNVAQHEQNGESNVAAGTNSTIATRTPDTLIYLADGTNYAVTSYWLADGNLHYMTSYGAENSVPIGQVDLQRTVDANAARGVQFTLRPAPPADSDATD